MKRILSFFMILCILSLTSYSAFLDMPENEEDKKALLTAVENGLISGISETKIAPYATITRSQMGAILVRAMKATRKADISDFADVSPNAWYYDEMRSAVAMGAFQGDGGVNLFPDKEITYQEAFVVLSRVFDLRYENPEALKKFSDYDSVADWAKDAVLKIISGGYFNGSMLNPKMPINRAEFAKIMNNLVKNYIDVPGTYTELPEGNTLVRCDGVVFDGIKNIDAESVTEGDLIIIGDGVKESSVINSDGVNVVVRGGNLKISGNVGIVRAVTAGTVLTPVYGEYSGKLYPDGSKGVISAKAEGSYISLEY